MANISPAILQYIPKDLQPMVEEGMQLRKDRDLAKQQEALAGRAAFQAKIDQNKVALDEQRIVALAAIDNEAKELDEETLQFPAVRHDLNRERRLVEFEYARNMAKLNTYGFPAQVADREIKMVEDSFKERFGEELKSYKQTKGYDAAKENWGQIQDRGSRISTVKEELLEGQRLIMEGKRETALSLFKQSVMKGVNSLISPDAVQIGELLIRYPELLDAAEINQLTGRTLFGNAIPFFTKLIKRDPFVEEDKRMLVQALGNIPVKERVNLLQKMFDNTEADPERFYSIAAHSINGASEAFNNDVKSRVVSPASPGIAKEIGAFTIGKVKSLRELAEEREAVNRQQDAEDMSFRGNTFRQQPVQSGSTQMPAPTQQAAPAVDIAGIRARLQSGYKK
jgi:hypothetical protein